MNATNDHMFEGVDPQPVPCDPLVEKRGYKSSPARLRDVNDANVCRHISPSEVINRLCLASNFSCYFCPGGFFSLPRCHILFPLFDVLTPLHCRSGDKEPFPSFRKSKGALRSRGPLHLSDPWGDEVGGGTHTHTRIQKRVLIQLSVIRTPHLFWLVTCSSTVMDTRKTGERWSIFFFIYLYIYTPNPVGSWEISAVWWMQSCLVTTMFLLKNFLDFVQIL